MDEKPLEMLTTAEVWFAVEFFKRSEGCASTQMALNRYHHMWHTLIPEEALCLIEIDFFPNTLISGVNMTNRGANKLDFKYIQKNYNWIFFNPIHIKENPLIFMIFTAFKFNYQRL